MTPEVIASGAPAHNVMSETKLSDFGRFFGKVVKNGNCWQWTSTLDGKGYGRFWCNGKSWWVHRWAYAVFCGDIPAGLTIDHKCHNPGCVNPAHLAVATRAENTAEGNVRRAIIYTRRRRGA